MYVHKYVTLILDFFKNIRIKFSKFSWKHFKDIFSWDFSFNKIKIYLSFLKPYFSKTFIFFKTYFTLILSYLWSFLRFMVLTKWGWLLLFIAILLTTHTCPFVVGWFNTGCVYLEVFYNKYVVSNQHMKKLASFFRLDVWLKMLFNLDVHEIVANWLGTHSTAYTSKTTVNQYDTILHISKQAYYGVSEISFYRIFLKQPLHFSLDTVMSKVYVLIQTHTPFVLKFYDSLVFNINLFLMKFDLIGVPEFTAKKGNIQELTKYTYYLDRWPQPKFWRIGMFTLSGIFFILTVIAAFWNINTLGLYGCFILTTFGLFIFWGNGLCAVLYIWGNNLVHTPNYGKWFQLTADLTVYFNFYFDSLSMAFALLVLSIAFFINIYIFAYFRYEPNVTRLILFIDIFVVSMVLLVTAGNFILMYLGWELIGITSFFLINFWAGRMGTVKAGFKAFTFNKISDCCILLGIVLIYSMMNHVDIVTFNNTVSSHMQTEIRLVKIKLPAIHSLTYLFMIAAFIKSAQFGFHIWLPDSMEAPVPASALIHSATLVSAGIFLILRCYPLFELSPFARTYIIFFGAVTAFFGGVCSIFQTDVKRLLAYSTISHCGVLMFLTFFKNPDLVIIYLYVHGFFKAIIFMCMGHVIRFAGNYQDMRRMGGFYKYLPFEAFLSFIALSNLGGVSFTWGYYMKHFLLMDSSPESQFNLFCYILVVLGSLCGLIYSYKLYYYVFFDFKKARKHVYMRIPNHLNKNIYFTNSSLASNLAITGLTITAYCFCAYLISKYICDHNIHFDWTYLSNYKNNLKNFNTEFFLNFYFYINWIIVIIMSFILFNNWKNKVDPSFKIKFFTFCWTYAFFFYIFYSILSV